MRSEAACETARIRLSVRLDDKLSSDEAEALEGHLAGCEDCRRYQASLHELRRSLRVVPAAPAPDLTGAILAEIAQGDEGEVRRFRIKLAAVAAAAAALLVMATAIPIFERTPDIARGAEITRRVFAAGRSLTRYHATFGMTERGWHRDIPIRRFSAEVWFDAPESFRLHVEDHTEYPSSAWPTNDVEVVSRASRWSINESYSCPAAALPGCAVGAGKEERTIVARQPFDGASDAPRDLVVPLDSLAGPDTFVVSGRTRLNGRDAYRLSLPYRQAFPLVEALQIGGSWTPYVADDSVDLWVDTETAFPLRFRITRGSLTLLDVKTLTLEEPGAFDEDLFDAPLRGTVGNGGFSSGPGPGSQMLPAYTSGLEPYRSGRNAQGQQIATYVDGLGYLKVITQRATRPAPLLLQSAQVVELGPGSRGFYRPATPDAPRRLDVYSRTHHVQLVTNLRRAALLDIGSSLPLEGHAPAVVRRGRAVTERLSATAVAQVPYAHELSEVPEGYSLVSTVRTSDPASSQLVQHYMPTESGATGAGIRVVQSPDGEALPPSSEELTSVRIDGVLARWSEARGELEWIAADGVYRALAAPSFDLDYVLELARGLN